MPQKNVAKLYKAHTYYHVYNHAVSNEEPFFSEASKQLFIKLFARYLGDDTQKNTYGMTYPDLSEKVKIIAFCVLHNHFHFVFYQISKDGITDIMRRTMTSFSKITNVKQERRGTLFETTFKASEISNDMYLSHAVRYVHLNPLDIGEDYLTYKYSSFLDYTISKRFAWLDTDKILKIFNNNKTEFEQFTRDGVQAHLTRK